MSRILVDQIRSNSASSDALTLDGSGNLTIPGNLTCSGNASISGTPTGFGGGKILQVVQNENNTEIATSGSTGADFLVGTITPAATSSKILIHCNVTVVIGSTNNAICGWYLYRGASSSGTLINSNLIGKDDSGGFYGGCWMTSLDSPNTTSATTYTLKASRGSQYTGNITATTGHKKSITMIEVGA